jgi:TRAP-type C4-dicarboxylate transport system permease small subunit
VVGAKTIPEDLPAPGPPPGTPARRGLMDRFIDGIEWIAAIFVGIVAADIFISVLLRNLPPFLSRILPAAIVGVIPTAIPDGYDFGRMLLGILIFWGIAATSYRGTHITVDLVWSSVSPRYQRLIDIFATLVLLFVVAMQTTMLFDKVAQTRADNVLTYDLRLPTWPFFAVAWVGDVSAVLLIAIRTWRLIVEPEAFSRTPLKPVE